MSRKPNGEDASMESGFRSEALDAIIGSVIRVERRHLAVLLEYEMSRQNKNTSYGRSVINALARIHQQLIVDNG